MAFGRKRREREQVASADAGGHVSVNANDEQEYTGSHRVGDSEAPADWPNPAWTPEEALDESRARMKEQFGFSDEDLDNIERSIKSAVKRLLGPPLDDETGSLLNDSQDGITYMHFVDRNKVVALMTQYDVINGVALTSFDIAGQTFVGSSKRHPNDMPDERVGVHLSVARALRSAAEYYEDFAATFAGVPLGSQVEWLLDVSDDEGGADLELAQFGGEAPAVSFSTAPSIPIF